MGKDRRNYLERDGKNEKLNYGYTAVTASNGETLVAPNCLQCHAQEFEDNLYIGLGNTFIDFTHNEKLNVKNLQRLESMLKLTARNKYDAAKPFIDVTKTVGPYLETDVRGVNSADRLAAILAAHRDPVTFQWIATPQLPIPTENIPTDTPPWWLLRKKNAMFYNGFGRGDFGRFLMASNLLTVNDTLESREVDSHMPDVLAYIYSLRPPKYPKVINAELAKEGEAVFIMNCSKCHGKYGEEESYPNLLIPALVIQTDSFLYKSNYSNPQFTEWFNKSWFTKGDHPARLEPFTGYIAPPLDGIWVTAPYLHNGSVPTLEALLNSELRPKYWTRDFDKPEYDYSTVGWKYTKQEKPGKNTYNTDLSGYGNYGHYFGDQLSKKERKALLEYLKTL
jgi:mono/diheme cytochrome c family protein